MAVSLIVRDFRIIKEAKITVEGLTVIKGQSSEGKSSFIKAIKAAMHNRFKSGCIRYGENQTQIKVRFDGDPRVLSVTRFATGSPRVSLGVPKTDNIQVWSKLNRDLPNEVIDFLNLGQINVSNSEKYDLNFFDQFEPPLLVGFSQKKIMDVLSASPALDDLNKVRKELDIRRTKAQGVFESVSAVITDTKARMASMQLQYDSMSGLDDVEPIINEIKGLKERQIQLKRVQQLLNEVKVLRLLIKRLNNLGVAQEDLNLISEKNEKLIQFKSIIQVKSLLKRIVHNIGIQKVQVIALADLSDRRTELTILHQNLFLSMILSSMINRLSSEVFSSFIGTTSDQDRLGRLQELRNLKVRKSQLLIAIDTIKTYLQVLDKSRELLDKKSQLEMTVLKLDSLKGQLKFANGLRSEVETISEVIEKNLCPYCGRVMDNHTH